MRWVGAGLLGLGLLTQACGKTARDGAAPHGDHPPPTVGGAHDDYPAMAGEPPVGGPTPIGGSGAVGGAPGQAGDGGAPNEGGVGGVAPEPRRPITAHVVDPVMGPVEGMKVYIAGETFVSDADGIVKATAPVGEYDAVVLDTGFDSGADAEWATGIHMYQGLTTAAPVFSLPRDYADQLPPESEAHGKVRGSYPDGLFGGIVFDAVPPQLWAVKSVVTAGVYDILAAWYVSDTSTDGHLNAMLWSRNADSQPTAFWFGQTAITWGPSLPLVTTDINVAPLPARELTLQVQLPAGTHAYGTFNTGPAGGSGYFGTAFAWTAGADDALVATTHVVPVEPLPNPALHTSFELVYGENVADSKLPAGTVVTRLPIADNVLMIDNPKLPTLLQPADGAKKITATTTFRFDAIPNTCHTVRLDGVTIHTARGEFTPPDLGPSGAPWPSAQAVDWSVTSTGPCSSIDALVTPSDVVAERTTWFSLGTRTFTTAR